MGLYASVINVASIATCRMRTCVRCCSGKLHSGSHPLDGSMACIVGGLAKASWLFVCMRSYSRHNSAFPMEAPACTIFRLMHSYRHKVVMSVGLFGGVIGSRCRSSRLHP